MQDWFVWDVVPVAESWSLTGKAPLQGKWVDVNTGDLEKLVVRSSRTPSQMNSSRQRCRWKHFGCCYLMRPGGGRQALEVAESWYWTPGKRTYASAERSLYVALPPEVRGPGVCARLRRSLYGTRDAPARWEVFLSRQWEGKGFVRGSSPCFHRHSSKVLSCGVHGDDFVFACVESDLAWARQQMEKRQPMEKKLPCQSHWSPRRRHARRA